MAAYNRIVTNVTSAKNEYFFHLSFDFSFNCPFLSPVPAPTIFILSVHFIHFDPVLLTFATYPLLIISFFQIFICQSVLVLAQ